MIRVKLYDREGKGSSGKILSDAIFGVKMKSQIVSQAANVQLANRRRVIASTKNRGEVRGGGRKPFRQKGTGNARAGSNRSPLWIGGGITFGPSSNRSYQQRFPAKMKNAALKMLLSQKVREKKFIVLKSLSFSKISTKEAANFFQKLPIEEGRIAVILPKLDANLELSLTNLPYLKTIRAENLNILDLLKYDYLVTDLEGVEKIEKVLTGQKTEAK